VLPALADERMMPAEEWQALGPDEQGRGVESHPQFHLKLLLDRMDVAREEARTWPSGGRFSSSAARGRAVTNAMVAAD
jgi:ATP-dependent helicase/nuclease subunit B